MSSVLETLYILVKLETAEIKKGVEQANSEINKLETKLGELGKAGDVVGESFRGVLSSVVGLFAGFASFHAILSGATGAIQALRDVGQASRELNVDVTALDAWGHAVQRTGGSAAQFQHSLAGLSQHFGTTNAIALQALPRLADAFQRLNPRQALNYGKSLGIDQATILLLQQGRREVESTINQQYALGLATKQQIEVTRKFDNALYDAKRAYENFYKELALPLLPGFTTGINYLISHKGEVEDVFKGLAIAAGGLSLALIRLNPILAGIVASIGTLIAGFAVIKEDVNFYFQGKGSALGKLEEAPAKLGAKALQFFGFGGKDDGLLSQLLIGGLAGVPIGEQHNFRSQGSTSVKIDKVEIVTQATDAAGIAASAAPQLMQHIAQANSQFDNGVAK